MVLSYFRWSDCTANWREKWSKVRTERNKAREDVRLLRGRVDAATKEAAALKRDKQELEAEVDQLRRELDYLRWGLINPLFCFFVDGILLIYFYLFSPFSPSLARIADDPPSVDHEVQLSSTASSATHAELEHLEKLLDAEATNGLLSQREPEQTDQRTPLLQLRLDEAAKLLLAERQEKNQLAKMLEKQATELGQLKAKYDELRKSRQDTLKELSQVKAEHQDELECIRIDLEDEASGRTCLDKRLTELRAQLVQLQGENAAEWGRRERLETEKLTLERDNKNLRASLQELQECLQRKAQPAGPTSDLRTVQAELQHRTKELLDLKHAHSKLKKVLQEKSTELSHALRRSDQYEMEVKKLRGRIEELKKELATAEDEVDSATNNIRKLQRCNDELQEQVETLQVQLEHLQTR
ncbi:unnamed protein product [Ixodes pacificus]